MVSLSFSSAMLDRLVAVFLFLLLSAERSAHRVEAIRVYSKADDGALSERSVPVVSTSAAENENEASSATEPRKLAVNVPTSPDEHLVHDLPLLAPDAFPFQQWAGHLPASDDGTKYFFYWLFGAADKHDDDSIPLLIWLNGGPGCSSMDGLFLENGPLRFTKDAQGNFVLTANPYSWHEAPAYTLYIDQPVGTGLSFTTDNKGYPANDAEVNADFYAFLIHFFELHSDKFIRDNRVVRPFYFSGESHAGHYIPSMMNYILKQNASPAAKFHIPLKGAAIGNGWMDPMVQYAAGEAAYGLGLIGRAQLHALDAKEVSCQKLLSQGRFNNGVCFDLLDDIVHQSYGSGFGYQVSMYDVSVSEPRSGGGRRYPPGHKVVETYLGGHRLPSYEDGTMDEKVSESVLRALHAEAAKAAGQIYLECTDPPYNALSHQDGLGVVNDVVEVLEHPSKPRLLFFNGVLDLIVNHVGNEKALENLPWRDRENYVRAQRYAWKAASDEPTKVSGFVKEYNNLLFLKVLDAGHMVPLSKPAVSLDMIQTFLHEKKTFQYSVQNLGTALEPRDATCPICPECTKQSSCPPCQTVENATVEECQQLLGVAGTSASGTKLNPSFVWILPVAGIVLILAAFLACRGKREKDTSSVATNVTMELSEPSRYLDDPGVGRQVI